MLLLLPDTFQRLEHCECLGLIPNVDAVPVKQTDEAPGPVVKVYGTIIAIICVKLQIPAVKQPRGRINKEPILDNEVGPSFMRWLVHIRFQQIPDCFLHLSLN